MHYREEHYTTFEGFVPSSPAVEYLCPLLSKQAASVSVLSPTLSRLDG